MKILSEHRPVLLFAFANDDRPGRRLDGLRREIEEIRRVLLPAEREGLCEVLVRESTTPDELIEVIEDPRFRRRLVLAHFAGHANESRLLLEGQGTPVAAKIGGLAPLLGELENLEVLFLNGCATVDQGQRLIQEGIPAVIATEHTVEDQRTQRFAGDFYRALASGASIHESFERALSRARCFAPVTGPHRDLAAPPRREEVDAPWRLLLADPRGDTKDWSLPTAADDPLFGLPAPVGAMLPQEPFMGLRRFTARDSAVFFGRGRAIRNLYHDVLDPEMPSILVVYGASGVGKSSLLEAGLMPRVAATSETHEIRLEHEQEPERLLRRALEVYDDEVDLRAAWRSAERLRGRPVVICIDQLEVLVVDRSRAGALARFVRALAPLYEGEDRPKGKLVLGLRKEWFPELRRELQRHRMAWHKHFVEPLDREDIEEVVLGPTRTASMRARYGITLDEDLAERIADDLSRDHGSAIAPMLQILLRRMWARAEPSLTSLDGRIHRHFSSEMYDDLCRDGLGLSDFVDRQLGLLEETHADELESGLVLDLLYQHTTPRGTAATRTYTELHTSYAHQRERMDELIERCVSLYLLQPVVDEAGGEDGVRLAHDTLAPIIRARHRCSRAPGQAAARLLEARMSMTETSQRSRLLDEHDLEEVEAAQGGMRGWTEAERELVAKSRRRRRRAAWARAGRRVVIAGSMGGLLFLYIHEQSDGEAMPPAQEDHATRELGTEETSAEASDLRDDGRNAKCPTRRLSMNGGGTVAAMEVTADGTRLAVGMDRTRAFVLDPLDDHPEIQQEITTRQKVNVLAWHPRQERLAIGQEGGVLQLTGELVTCTGHDASVTAVRFSRDGSLLMSADDDGRVVVRNANDCAQLQRGSLGDRAEVLAEGAASEWMVAGRGARWMSWFGPGISSSTSTGILKDRLARDAIWGPHGGWILGAGYHLYAEDTSTGDLRVSKDRSPHVIHWVVPIAGSSDLLTVGEQEAILWDGPAPESTWSQLQTSSFSTAIEALATSPDGQEVFLATAEGTVHWLRPSSGTLTPKRSFELSSSALTTIAIDPQLRYLATGGQQGEVILMTLPDDLDHAETCELVPITRENLGDE